MSREGMGVHLEEAECPVCLSGLPGDLTIAILEAPISVHRMTIAEFIFTIERMEQEAAGQ